MYKLTPDSVYKYSCKFHLQAGLLPTDDITVYYNTSAEVSKVVLEYNEYIFSTVKQPLKPFPVPAGENIIIQTTMDKKVISYVPFYSIMLCMLPAFNILFTAYSDAKHFNISANFKKGAAKMPISNFVF